MGLSQVLEWIVGLSEEDREKLESQIGGENGTETEFFDLSQSIPGYADERLEVFAEGGATEDFELDLSDKEKKSNLLWAPMIHEGQQAVRPGPAGQKVRRKMTVIAGRSEDGRKTIGLQDLKDAFDEDAVENVTIPVARNSRENAHDNSTLQNTGFIRAMKIGKSTVTKGPRKGQQVATLFGGHHFTEPGIEAKVKRGTIAGRSCGILYDYVNTETGKSYTAAVDHEALTNSPWIRGMRAFGQPLALAEDLEPESMRLTEDNPEVALEDEDVSVSLADNTTVTWPHEESPNWLRQQVDQVLQTARTAKRKAKASNPSMYVDDSPPWYRAVEAKPGTPGKVLVSDGYGDDSNFWVADITVKDGGVDLDPFDKWQAVKKVFTTDDRQPPPPKQQPLADVSKDDGEGLTELQRARRRRAEQLNLGQAPPLVPEPESNTPRGGEQQVAGETTTHELSEAARQQIEELKASLAERDRKLADQERVLARLTESDTTNKTTGFLGKLRGMGFTEENGFSALLAEVEQDLLAADADPIIGGEQFSEDGTTEVNLSLADVLERVFDRVAAVEGIGDKLGHQLAAPSDTTGKKDGEKLEDTSTKPGSDGKPAQKESGEVEEPKTKAETLAAFAEDNAQIMRELGLNPDGTPIAAASASTNGGN